MNSPKDLRLSCISETKQKKCEIDIFIYGGCTKLIEMSALEHTHAQSKPEFSSSGTEKSLEKKRKERSVKQAHEEGLAGSPHLQRRRAPET